MSLTILIITGLALIPAAYLLLLGLAALSAPHGTSGKADGKHDTKVAFLIPAHNEQELLPITLQKIAEADYPAELVQCFVIADNCSDDTADAGRREGALVYERKGMEDGRGKPFALRWFFAEHGDQLRSYDVISIIDADTEICPAFISEITSAMKRDDVQVAQGYYGTSNVEKSWRAAFAEVALTVSHHVRTLGRNRLSATCGLKGNGMAFDPEILLRNGWPAHALDEDLELTLLLMEQGIQVRYVPKARIYAEMASDPEGATKQRLRWEGGRLELIWKYGKRLASLLLSKRCWGAIESILDLLTPPTVIYFLGLAGLTAVNLLLWELPAAIAAAVGMLILAAITIQGLIMRGAPRRCWMVLLEFPKLAWWKLMINLKLINPKTNILWERTTRDHESKANFASAAMPRHGTTFRMLNSVGGRVNALRRHAVWRWLVRMTHRFRRSFDIMGALFAIGLLSPIFIVTAFLIRLEDRGPIFFKQTRVGVDGTHFQMWKFRSMYVDAEARLDELRKKNQHGKNGVTFKIKEDPRITKVGKFIRKYSIDEFPQFFNVLRGDMSLVGPRPPLPSEVAYYKSIELRRLTVKPGISCLWQIQGRSDIDFPGQVRLDLQYIHTATLLKDIAILLKTVPAVISARGAY